MDEIDESQSGAYINFPHKIFFSVFVFITDISYYTYYTYCRYVFFGIKKGHMSKSQNILHNNNNENEKRYVIKGVIFCKKKNKILHK